MSGNIPGTQTGVQADRDLFKAAMREVRIALLEADVALPVVKDFIEKVQAEAVGQDVLRSVTPGQMVVRLPTTIRPCRRKNRARPCTRMRLK